MDFKDKSVLVAGGTGLVGMQLVNLLMQEKAKVVIASLDDESRAHPDAWFKKLNLLHFPNCLEACHNIDYVFNLLCVKGSPQMVKERPADFFDINLLLDINLLRAARLEGAQGLLLASSLAVYEPAEVFYEGDVWSKKTYPSENDWFAGWAKRMGEVQADAYRIQYGMAVSVVRPANIYGPFDDFESKAATAFASITRKVLSGESPIILTGNGSNIRDFIHARDVARGMLAVAQKGVTVPVNLGSGTGISIKQLVELMLNNTEEKPKVVWDTSIPSGDKIRVLDVSFARSLGIYPEISFEDGIRETLNWYRENKGKPSTRFNMFS